MSIESDLTNLAKELKRAGSPGPGALCEVAGERFGPEHPTHGMSFKALMSMCERVTGEKWEGLGEAEAEARR